jgi:hypothetical protein
MLILIRFFRILTIDGGYCPFKAEKKYNENSKYATFYAFFQVKISVGNA